ncbi:EF-hand calcium-binding domain-containing protein 7 isoform X3 [Loxodonta africana]
MTQEEVNAIITLADVNTDGKFDYLKFCKLYMTTSEQCLKTTLEKLEVDSKLRRQQFGSHIEGSPERDPSPIPKSSPRIIRKTDQETFSTKGDARSSLLSATRKFKTSVSFTIAMGVNSNRNSKLTEPNSLKEWQCAQSKGCFFLEEDSEVISHQYRMQIPQRSMVYLTIKPLNLSQVEGKPSPWLSVDTALYILKENESHANLQLVCFTELRNREVFGWTGELGPGMYWLIPFTTGCKLKKEIKPITEEAQLVYRDEMGELFLTKEFRSTLSDIFEIIDLDGNGLLSIEEYNFFELRTSGEKCDEDAWAVCRGAIRIVKDFILLGTTINSHGSSSQEIKRCIALGKSAAKGLFKVLKSKDVTLKTKVHLTQAMVFSITSYACESWTMNKEDRRRAFELWCWRRMLNIPWTAKRMNKSVLEEVQPECSLEAKMARLRLTYFGHVVRRDQSLEKDIILGRVQGQRKRGRPSTRWTDTVAATVSSSITTIVRMAQHWAVFRSVVHRIAMSWNQLNGT